VVAKSFRGESHDGAGNREEDTGQSSRLPGLGIKSFRYSTINADGRRGSNIGVLPSSVCGMATVVFTDGACSGNPGPGGWGWSIVGGISANGAEKKSTNQRMELWAVLDALNTIVPLEDGTIEVVSDSTYVVNCFNNRWWPGWEAKGWKNSQKQPVANQDLWKPLVALYKRNRDRITFRWVKGHSGNPMNDKVDALAVAAAQGQTERTEFALDGTATVTGGSALNAGLGTHLGEVHDPGTDGSEQSGHSTKNSATAVKRPTKAVAKRKPPVAPKVVLENEPVARKSLEDARAALNHSPNTDLRLF
jgi:ribonuclease HI